MAGLPINLSLFRQSMKKLSILCTCSILVLCLTILSIWSNNAPALCSDTLKLLVENDWAVANNTIPVWNTLEVRAAISIPSTVNELKFTIILLLYDRFEQAQTALRRYCNYQNVSKIIVLWNNLKVPISNTFYQIEINASVPIIYLQSTVNSLTHRFLPRDLIDTQGVLHLDDDIVSDELELQGEFKLWKANPHLIVGKTRKVMNRGKDGLLSYGGVDKDTYSLILTNAAFLHVRYHEAFYRLPFHVLSMIDEKMNCEDIAMNFVVSSICNCTAGLFSNGRRRSRRALSSRPDHYTTRTKCCRILSKELGIAEIKPRNIYDQVYTD